MLQISRFVHEVERGAVAATDVVAGLAGYDAFRLPKDDPHVRRIVLRIKAVAKFGR